MRFRATDAGVTAHISAAEAAVLARLPELLATAGDPDDDPGAARLSPHAYPDDPEADAEFARLAGADLARARTADRSRFATSVRPGKVRLTPDEAEAWLRVLAETRLLLAARAGIEEDGWTYEELGDDPRMTLLHYLSAVQDGLIGALMGDLRLPAGE